MDLGAIRTALETWVASVTGLPVRWAERPQQFGADQMVLHIRGFRGVGLDEIDETYDATTPLGTEWGSVIGGITPTQTGQRVGTLELRAELQSQSSGEDALYYVQLLRDRLALPACSDALEAAGAAIGGVLLEPRELSVTKDMRRVSVAQMDVELNAASGAAGVPYANIETVGITVAGRDEDDVVVFSVDATLEE